MIANNDGWIEWTWSEEKPYPETLDTAVDVRFKDGCIFKEELVLYWCASNEDDVNCWEVNRRASCSIVAYRVVN